MKLSEAIHLIQTNELISDRPQTWADLGCGSGLFTRALAGLLPPKSSIYAIDKDISSLNAESIPDHIRVLKRKADFETRMINLENLDGIMMANSLHFIRDKKSFLETTKMYFRRDPVFLIVEYDTDIANRWVPFPISFLLLKQLFLDSGLQSVQRISEKPSLYQTGKLYSSIIK